MKLNKTIKETIRFILCVIVFVFLTKCTFTINFIDPVVSQTVWYMIILTWLLHRFGIYIERII